jgi:hypothetical protein
VVVITPYTRTRSAGGISTPLFIITSALVPAFKRMHRFSSLTKSYPTRAAFIQTSLRHRPAVHSCPPAGMCTTNTKDEPRRSDG